MKKEQKSPWVSYCEIMRRYYHNLSLDDQRELRVRCAQIAAVGCTLILLSATYQFLPLSQRVVLLPVLIAVALYVSMKVDQIIEIVQRLKPSFTTLCMILVIAFAFTGIVWGIRQ